MSELYGFRSGPALAQRPIEDDFAAMMDEPMSLGSTFWDQTKGGVLESFGVGTAIRTLSLPPGAQARRGRETDEEYQARQERVKGITEEEYKSSPFYRSDVPWDRGMTLDRAAALAAMYDTKKVREYFAEKRPFTSFLGGLAGQAVDPINYIPIAGPAVKAASVAKFGTVAGVAATAALDAAANTAIAGLATRETRRSFGDDVSWQTMVTEIATAALIGSAFGTLGGVLERRAGRAAEVLRADAEKKVSTLKAVQESRVALNEAIGTLANDGEVRLSPNAVAPIERVTNVVPPRAVPDAGDIEPPPAPGMVRVYHSGSVGEGETGRWVSTNRTYASNYRGDLPLHYLDVPADDPRVNNADIPEQGVSQGFTFNFETTPEEAARLKTISRDRVVDSIEIAGRKEPVFEAATPAVTATTFPRAGGERVLFEPAAGELRQGTIFQNVSGGYALVRAENGRLYRSTWAAMADAPTLKQVDTSPPAPEPIPQGRPEAEARVAKPETYKALAEQYRVDPETGTFDEEADLRRLAQEGKLTDEDMADLDAVDAEYQDGAAFGEALRSVVGCLL